MIVSRSFEILTLTGAAGLLFGSLAMVVGGSISLIEVTTNFRPHLLVVASGILAIGLIVHRPAALMALTAMLVLAPSTLPYLVTSGVTPSQTAPEIGVLQYNTLFSNNDVSAIAQEILDADADVVALHEMTSDRWVALQPLISTSYPHFVNGLDEPLSEIRFFGTVLLSKTPIRSAADPAYPVAPVAAVTEIHGHDVLAIGLHPSPSRTDREKIDTRHELLAVTQSLVSAHDGPALVITDLNITPTSPEYRDFIEGLDWPDTRRTLGIEPTFPAGVSNPFGIAIDHVFGSPDLTVTDYALGDGGGSDHRSLVATVVFEPVESSS